MQSDRIIGKIVVKGKLELISPLIIGNSTSERADNEVILDHLGNPFIPGTSLTGKLKHYCCQNIPDEFSNELTLFWGGKIEKQANGNKYIESAFICKDLFPVNSNCQISIRDGIAIEYSTGITKKNSKYDYEVVESGIIFHLNWEVTLRSNDNIKFYKQILNLLLTALTNKEFSIGAKTNNGFGFVFLKDYSITEFDFKKKDDVINWLGQEYNGGKKFFEINGIPILDRNFKIEADFYLKNSIQIKSERVDLFEPDVIHIKSKNDYIIPGTSIKGCIRHRAYKIMKTINPARLKELDYLFGHCVKNNIKYKSRIQVSESIIDNVKPEVQTRIRIDRFTGGSIDGALFETMPLWSQNYKPAMKIKIIIRNFNKWEAGLMMLILKDLWTEDLPIGGEKNIGRGIIGGVSAKISWNDKYLLIKSKNGELEFSSLEYADELESFVKSVLK